MNLWGAIKKQTSKGVKKLTKETRSVAGNLGVDLRRMDYVPDMRPDAHTEVQGDDSIQGALASLSPPRVNCCHFGLQGFYSRRG